MNTNQTVLRHYIIYRGFEVHPTIYFVRAPSSREALTRYILKEYPDAEIDDNGNLQLWGNTYSHPLAVIESHEKSDHEWGIKKLRARHWQVDFTEVYFGEDPYSIKEYIELCRPELRKRYPRSRARAFVWYIEGGALVTFFRRKKAQYPYPIEILGRYRVLFETYPEVREWHGTYDDILNRIDVAAPVPTDSFPLAIKQQ